MSEAILLRAGQAVWDCGLLLEADECLKAASAVLVAIREPSDEMIRAGFEDYPALWMAGITPEDRVGIWQAMIDAALVHHAPDA